MSVESSFTAPWDECECGDYRRDHKDDGYCLLPNDLTHGFKRCLSFRLYREAITIPEPWAGIIAAQAPAGGAP